MSSTFATTIERVANFFYQYNYHTEPDKRQLALKINIMVFYSYGWYLANTDKLLFKESVLAYPWGPGFKTIHNWSGEQPLAELVFSEVNQD